jgi:hypothetical protein
MNQSPPEPKQIREAIARLEARRDAALAEAEAAVRELDWWRQGLALFDPAAAEEEKHEEAADAVIAHLVPAGYDTPDQTLRQSLMLAMRADPQGEWSVRRLHDMLLTHRWAKSDTKDLSKRITDMASLMVSDGLLERRGRGVYQLPRPIAAALTRALRPISDYGPRAD